MSTFKCQDFEARKTQQGREGRAMNSFFWDLTLLGFVTLNAYDVLIKSLANMKKIGKIHTFYVLNHVSFMFNHVMFNSFSSFKYSWLGLSRGQMHFWISGIKIVSFKNGLEVDTTTHHKRVDFSRPPQRL